jgi:hypothetical protein
MRIPDTLGYYNNLISRVNSKNKGGKKGVRGKRGKKESGKS